MLPQKSINIRLSPQLAERFEALKERFGGLAPSTILRFLVADALERTIDEQVQIVERQIHKPAKRPQSRIEPGTNTRRVAAKDR